MTFPAEDTRRSDRWVTPSVIVAGIVTSGIVILGIGAGLVFLQYKGIDPQPIIDLVTKIITAIGALGSLVLTLATRATSAKTERNTGIIANEQYAMRTTLEDRTLVSPSFPPVPGKAKNDG
jgi:nitrate/nitrite transporter NarK